MKTDLHVNCVVCRVLSAMFLLVETIGMLRGGYLLLSFLLLAGLLLQCLLSRSVGLWLG